LEKGVISRYYGRNTKGLTGGFTLTKRIMIAVFLAKPSTPRASRIEAFPIFPERPMGFRAGEIFAVFEKIQING